MKMSEESTLMFELTDASFAALSNFLPSFSISSSDAMTNLTEQDQDFIMYDSASVSGIEECVQKL